MIFTIKTELAGRDNSEVVLRGCDVVMSSRNCFSFDNEGHGGRRQFTAIPPTTAPCKSRLLRCRPHPKPWRPVHLHTCSGDLPKAYPPASLSFSGSRPVPSPATEISSGLSLSRSVQGP